ncbi:hypothetical protein [Xanthomonas melonis]|uniref:hypothetical protein n=1 Tax=Xanthomonas melonis TaxID=56456 RepID=UPI003EC0E21D
MELEFSNSRSDNKISFHPLKDNVFAIFLVILIHAVISIVLIRESASHTTRSAEDSALTLVFLPRIRPDLSQQHLRSRLDSQGVSERRNPIRPSTASAEKPSARKPEESSDSPRIAGEKSTIDSPHIDVGSSLVLTLPDDFKNPPQARSNGLSVPPSMDSPAKSRFDNSWAPDGQEIQQSWAFRSKAAALLLSATGALRRPCTELERKRMDKKCFGSQYEGDDLVRDSKDGLGDH